MIINQQEALETGPISGVSITKALRGQAATLDRLRGDRQLDEALTRGPIRSTSYGNSGVLVEDALNLLRRGRRGRDPRTERDGYLVLVDRKKDMIIWGGENIYPSTESWRASCRRSPRAAQR